ncbi:MAG: transglycosylase domain-containing protein [Coriobacteriia bacterium]|nr:transglycosylase domain-containing protein [Coriobacteriia bacterium]
MLISLTVVVGLSGLAGLGLYAMVQTWLTDLPSIETITQYSNERTTRVYANDGTTLLAEFYYHDRTPVNSDQVAQYVFDAIVAIEDERFWQHDGVDYYGVARAIFFDLTTNDVQGASTITMQLVRQTLLQDEANDITIRRKMREVTLAQQLEEIWTKEEILIAYLNAINFGDGCWGIQAAAQHYFSKDAINLTLVEAALLCGLPQSPEYNNPVNFPENAIYRRSLVLERMFTNGYITEEEMVLAKNADLGLNVRTRNVDGIYMVPYATSYAKYELLRDYGSNLIFNVGVDVYTSIDLNYQRWAEEACAAQEAKMRSDFEVSLTCVEPTTGYIMCMRGGRDYYSDQFNTCWQMRRQAGSSFKTFGLVAAIEKGYSPYTIVSTDSPLWVGDWQVSNYSGAGMGDMTLASATWRSSNTAYARVVRTIGHEAIADTARRMGITSDLVPYNSIVLGASGVCTLEMASAYGTLATNGIHNKPTMIKRIIDRSTGETIFEHEPTRDRVLTPEVAYAATNVLRGVVTQSGATGVAANIYGRDIAGKTGTSNSWWDAWFIGFTPQLSTAIWIGNRDEPTRMPYNEGGVVCAPVWRQFMLNTLDGLPALSFEAVGAPPYRDKADFLTAEERHIMEMKNTDTDGDTFSDWDEQEAGTDPNNPNDYPGKVDEPTTVPSPGINPPGGFNNGGAGGLVPPGESHPENH